MCITESPFSLMNISMAGQFSTHLMTSIYAGFILAFPYVFWEIWRFIVPALKDNETKITRGVVFFSSLLFLTGLAIVLSQIFTGQYFIQSLIYFSMALLCILIFALISWRILK